jgi:hypothetical protein
MHYLILAVGLIVMSVGLIGLLVLNVLALTRPRAVGDDSPTVSNPWLLSVIGGLLGPCALVAEIVALVWGFVDLKQASPHQLRRRALARWAMINAVFVLLCAVFFTAWYVLFASS